VFEFNPMPPFLGEVLAAGSLTAWVQKLLSERHAG
jgi:hypothetical protein